MIERTKLSERVRPDCEVPRYVYDEIVALENALAAALNAAGVVEAVEKLSITLELVDKYDLSKNVPWPVAELVREARALAAINGPLPEPPEETP